MQGSKGMGARRGGEAGQGWQGRGVPPPPLTPQAAGPAPGPAASGCIFGPAARRCSSSDTRGCSDCAFPPLSRSNQPRARPGRAGPGRIGPGRLSPRSDPRIGRPMAPLRRYRSAPRAARGQAPARGAVGARACRSITAITAIAIQVTASPSVRRAQLVIPTRRSRRSRPKDPGRGRGREAPASARVARRGHPPAPASAAREPVAASGCAFDDGGCILDERVAAAGWAPRRRQPRRVPRGL